MKKTLASSISVVICLSFVIIPFCVVDWGFLSGKITDYELFCSDGLEQSDRGCYAFNKSSYYPDKSTQTVVIKNDFELRRFTKCTVVNRRNWECSYDDHSASFGFNSGKFSEKVWWSAVRTPTEIDQDSVKFRHVSKIQYILELIGII